MILVSHRAQSVKLNKKLKHALFLLQSKCVVPYMFYLITFSLSYILVMYGMDINFLLQSSRLVDKWTRGLVDQWTVKIMNWHPNTIQYYWVCRSRSKYKLPVRLFCKVIHGNEADDQLCSLHPHVREAHGGQWCLTSASDMLYYPHASNSTLWLCLMWQNKIVCSYFCHHYFLSLIIISSLLY